MASSVASQFLSAARQDFLVPIFIAAMQEHKL